MATLADQIFQSQQQGAQDLGQHTVGTALQAYHIAATAEHARQELDMQKQEQDMNKAKWVASQLDNIGRTTGPTRDILIDSFGKQAQQLFPGMSQENIKMLKKDPEVLGNYIAAASNQLSLGQMSPDVAKGMLALGGSVDEVYKHATDLGHMKAMVDAARDKSQGMVTVRQEGVDLQGHRAAIKGISDNPNTSRLLAGYQSINNALLEFKNNPSPQSFHTLQNVARINAGSSGQSGVSERASTYATDLGIKTSEAKQIMTGQMQDVNLNSPEMVKAVIKVMDGELEQKRKQGISEIDKHAKGWQSFYERPGREGYKQDFNNAIDAAKSQFEAVNSATGSQSQPSSGITPDQAAAELERRKKLKGQNK